MGVRKQSYQSMKQGNALVEQTQDDGYALILKNRVMPQENARDNIPFIAVHEDSTGIPWHPRYITFRIDLIPAPRFVYISPGIEHLTGYSPNEFYANPRCYLELVHLECRSIVAHLLDSGETLSETVILHCSRKDGQEFWIEHDQWVTGYDNGNPIAVEGIIRDVSRQKRAEQQQALAIQQEREQHHQKIHERMGQVLGYVNGQAQAIANLIQNNQHHQAAKMLERLVDTIRYPHFNTINNLDMRFDTSAEQEAPPPPEDPPPPEIQTQSIRILLVDDNTLFLQALEKILMVRGFNVIGTASGGYGAIEQARLLKPDVILMDVQMPECDGLAATQIIKAEFPEIKIVMLSVLDDEVHLFDAIKYGASGYLLKGIESQELSQMLLALMQGEVPFSSGLAQKVLHEFSRRNPAPHPVTSFPAPLTDSQIRLLSLLAQGLTQREVAMKMGYAERTIRRHVGDILEQLHLNNRAEAISYARKKLALGEWQLR